jgi:hypothetical protein
MAKKTPMRTSPLFYEFVKAPKDAPDEDTILGCVLSGIRQLKRGSLDDVTKATLKAGFAKVSDQNAREKTRIFLRRLANDGVVKITRSGAVKPAAKKTRVKVVSAQ